MAIFSRLNKRFRSNRPAIWLLSGLVLVWLTSVAGQVQAALPLALTPTPGMPKATVKASPSPSVRPTLKASPTVKTTASPVSVKATSTAPATKTTTTPRPTTSPSPSATTVKPSPTPSPTPGPRPVVRPPVLQAPSAIAVEAESGKILYAKDAYSPRAIASTTKIITALTLLSLYPDPVALQAQTSIVQEDLVGEANMGLRKDERISLSTLLLGLMTNSANEAGMALARYAGARLSGPGEPVERFVAAMNTYARSLGMNNTHFMNPHGLDQPGHYSTAYDMALSGWAALRNPLLMQYAQYRSGQVDGHYIYNVNSFLSRYYGATGIKPGWTDDAGRTLVASARHKNRTVIAVVLGATTNIAGDVDSLMDYSFTLLDGRAEQSPAEINLGRLSRPGPGSAQPLPRQTPAPAPTAPPIVSPVVINIQAAPPTPTPFLKPMSREVFQVALQQQLDFTLRLAQSILG